MISTNKTSFASNLIAGITSAAWSGLAALIVVPFYIKALGVANYGLITFFATLQGLLIVFDLGLSTAINREVARAIVSGAQLGTRNLIHTLATLYWLVGVVIGAGIVMAAPFIGHSWLSSATTDQASIVSAVRLMGLVFVFRWPVGLYLGVLQGAHRIDAASIITIIATTLSTFGTVAVFEIVPATIEAFFVWQAAVAFAQVIAMQHCAWRVFGRGSSPTFSISEIGSIWYFSSLIAITTLMGAVLLQADKLILSAHASLEDVAVYGLAGLAARSLLLIVAPIYSAVYPRMSALVAAHQIDDVVELYRTGTKLLSIALCAIGTYICVNSYDLFVIWTHSQTIANSVHWILVALTIGTVLNGIMYFPHALQLAYGDAKLPLQINVLLFAFLLPALLLLVPRHGLVGAAIAWMGMNIVNLLAGTWLTHRSLLRGMGRSWLFQDALGPGLLTATIVFLGARALPRGLSAFQNTALALPIIPLAVLIVSAAIPDIRRLADRHRPRWLPSPK